MESSRHVSSPLQQNCTPEMLVPHFCWPVTREMIEELINEKQVFIATREIVKIFFSSLKQSRIRMRRGVGLI